MDHRHEEQHADLSRRCFMMRGIAAAGGAAALSIAGWGGPYVRDALARAGTPEGPHDEAYWQAIRAQFPFDPGLSYLNNGGLGAPPQPVVDAVVNGYRRLSANPSINEGELEDYIYDTVRPGLAKLVGADADEIALTRNATEGLNLIANGIEMNPGDEVLTTTHEHPAGLEPWLLKSQRYGIVVRQIRLPSPPDSVDQVVELFREGMNSRTKVLFFCHITRGPGLLYPVKELCALARERGIVSAVDAAQSVGMMDVNIHDMGCDLLANSLHKWLLAPIGSGLVYVRKDVQKRIFPLFAGSGPWDIVESGSDRYEAIGTHEVPVRAGIGAALDYINGIGIKNIEARNRMLSDYLRSKAAAIPGIRLLTSTSHDLSSPGITTIEVNGWSARELRGALQKRYNITASSDNRDGNNGVRISTHFYNTTQEIDRALEAIKELMQAST